MRNKILVLVNVSVVLALLFSGCVYNEPEWEQPLGGTAPEPNYTPYESPADIVEPSPMPDTPEPVTPANNPVTIDDQRPPDNVTWISPGKVMIGNFYAGGRAEYPVTIHNGNDVAAEFLVYYRVPDHVGEGYSMPNSEVEGWVMIVDNTPVLEPRETQEIMVVLEMPSNVKAPAPQWEFWVGVKDNSQTGMVQTELCVRWLVSMRES